MSGAAPRRVVVLGGTSEIALAIVQALPLVGDRRVALVGRDPDGLSRAAAVLSGVAAVETVVADAADLPSHGPAIEQALDGLDGDDGETLVVLAVGVLGERNGAPADPARAAQDLLVNGAGSGSLLLHAVDALKRRAGGTIVVLSSAAAVRARRSNPVYGAGKACLDALAQGLADALHGGPVRVMVVRPGFVHTRMTRGLKPAPLSSTPEDVAQAVVRAFGSGRNTVWVPAALGPVLLALRMLPRPVFRKLRL